MIFLKKYIGLQLSGEMMGKRKSSGFDLSFVVFFNQAIQLCERNGDQV